MAITSLEVSEHEGTQGRDKVEDCDQRIDGLEGVHGEMQGVLNSCQAEIAATKRDVTMADSGERLNIGERSMEHEVRNLNSWIKWPRSNKGKLKERKPKSNCFFCDEPHLFRDCPKREGMIMRLKEYEEGQRLEEEPTVLEDSSSTKVDEPKEAVEELEEPRRGGAPKEEEPQNPEVDRGREHMEYIPQAETVMEIVVQGCTQWLCHEGGSSLSKGGGVHVPKAGTQRRHLVKKHHHPRRTRQFRSGHKVGRRHEDNAWNFPKTVVIFRKKRRRGRRQIWWGRMSRPAKRDKWRRGRRQIWCGRMSRPAKGKKQRRGRRLINWGRMSQAHLGGPRFQPMAQEFNPWEGPNGPTRVQPKGGSQDHSSPF